MPSELQCSWRDSWRDTKQQWVLHRCVCVCAARTVEGSRGPGQRRPGDDAQMMSQFGGDPLADMQDGTRGSSCDHYLRHSPSARQRIAQERSVSSDILRFHHLWSLVQLKSGRLQKPQSLSEVPIHKSAEFLHDVSFRAVCPQPAPCSFAHAVCIVSGRGGWGVPNNPPAPRCVDSQLVGQRFLRHLGPHVRQDPNPPCSEPLMRIGKG